MFKIRRWRSQPTAREWTWRLGEGGDILTHLLRRHMLLGDRETIRVWGLSRLSPCRSHISGGQVLTWSLVWVAGRRWAEGNLALGNWTEFSRSKLILVDWFDWLMEWVRFFCVCLDWTQSTLSMFCQWAIFSVQKQSLKVVWFSHLVICTILSDSSYLRNRNESILNTDIM